MLEINFINEVLEKFNQNLRLVKIVTKNTRHITHYFNNDFEIRYASDRRMFENYINNADDMMNFNSRFFDIRYSNDEIAVENIKKEYYWYYTRKGLNSPGHYKFPKGYVPVNKGIKGGVGWSRGLNKTNDSRFAKMSEDRKGDKNPMFGTTYSEEDRTKKSIHMKNIIEAGTFTPKTENRLSRWKAEYDGKVFRSSWEACFYFLNNHCEYEKVRIRYYDTNKNKERIYIVDFVDEINKILYEVRPKNLQHNMTDKLIAADKYMNSHGYTFKFIDEDYIRSVKSLIESSDLSEDIKKKIRKLK
jgi:hypothetical protein